MNKLFTKIAGAVLGLTMVIGVGAVVAGNLKETPLVAEAASSATSTAITLDMSSNEGWVASANTSEKTITIGSYTFGYKSCYWNNQKYLMMVKSAGVLYNKTPIEGISSISVTYSNGTSEKGYLDIKNASSVLSTYSTSGYVDQLAVKKNTTYTTKGTYGLPYIGLNVHNNNNVQVTKIIINLKPISVSYTVAISVNDALYGSVDKTSVTNVASGTTITSTNNVLKIGNNTVTATASESTAQYSYAFSNWTGIPSGGTVTENVKITANFIQTVNPVEKLTISGSMTKTEYAQGDAWDPSGFTVNALYTGSSTPVDVTKDVQWTYNPSDTKNVSTKTVICTASFGGKTVDSEPQNVNIQERVNLGGIVDGEKYFIVANGFYLKSFSSTSKVENNAAAWNSETMPDVSDTWTFTSTGETDTWIITNNSGNVLYSISDNNGLRCKSTEDSWTVLQSENGLKLKDKNQSRYLTYYSGGNFRTYTSTSVQGEQNSTIEFVKYEKPVLLESISLSGTYQTEFTLNSTFNHNGLVVTAHYDDDSSKVLEEGYVVTEPSLNTVGSKTITVSYTEKNITKTETYDIKVVYENVESLSINIHELELENNEIYNIKENITVTISGPNSNPGYEWIISDDGGLDTDTELYFDGTEFSSAVAGVVVLRCQSVQDNSKHDELVITINCNPYVQIFDSESNVLNDETLNRFVGDDPIYVQIETINLNGVLVYQWETTLSNVTNIEAEDEFAVITPVVKGTTQITCTVTDENNISASASFTLVIENVEITELTWEATDLDVWSDDILDEDTTDNWYVSYKQNNGVEDVLTQDDFSVVLGGKTITLPYTWESDDNGKTLYVEYQNKQTTTINVTVTQRINSVLAESFGQYDYTFSKQQWSSLGDATLNEQKWTSSGTAKDGGYFGIDNNGKGQQFGSGKKPFSNLTLSTYFENNVKSVTISTSGASSIEATVQAFVNGVSYGEPVSLTATNTTYIFAKDENYQSGTLEIKWVNSSEKAIYIKDISVEYSSGTQDIANDENFKAAQRAVVKFAKAFNTAMDSTNYCTENLENAWALAEDAWTNFNAEINTLTPAEKEYAIKLIKYASANYTNNTDDNYSYALERAMKTYQVCVNNHGLEAFMDSIRPLSANMNRGLTILKTENASALVIVTISLLSVAALGGYFLLRKRKENQ